MVVSAGMPSVVDSSESKDHIRLIPNDSNGTHTLLLKRPVHLIHSSTIQTDSVYLFYLLAAVSRCCDDVR